MKSLDAPAELLRGADCVEIKVLGWKYGWKQTKNRQNQQSQFHESSIEESGVRIYRVLGS